MNCRHSSMTTSSKSQGRLDSRAGGNSHDSGRCSGWHRSSSGQVSPTPPQPTMTPEHDEQFEEDPRRPGRSSSLLSTRPKAGRLTAWSISRSVVRRGQGRTGIIEFQRRLRRLLDETLEKSGRNSLSTTAAVNLKTAQTNLSKAERSRSDPEERRGARLCRGLWDERVRLLLGDLKQARNDRRALLTSPRRII